MKPIILIIMDGYGLGESDGGNAIAAAKKPNLDRLWTTCPHTTLKASGNAVGLPDGQMGNSEVGHAHLGSGRICWQDLERIERDIESGVFFNQESFLGAIENCKKHNSALHLYGLLSDKGVHSRDSHLHALLELAKDKGLTKVYIHCFTDGRDAPTDSAPIYIEHLQEKIAELGIGEIASIMGRYWAMDRDKHWDRIEKAYRALIHAEGSDYGEDPIALVRESYAKGVTDEFINPCIITKNGEPVAKIEPNDSVIYYNYRKDRGIEITRAIVDPEFCEFETKHMPLYYVCMAQYDQTMPNVQVVYYPISVDNILPDYLGKMGLTQLRIAETEKYAHVTFFFNGGLDVKFPGEDRVLIPSPAVPTFDLKPEMSAYEITDAVIPLIKENKYNVIMLNFANGDMVGHTGVFDAAVKAIEAVDECVGNVVNAMVEAGGIALVTADHGNAETMKLSNGDPATAHTVNDVPFIVVGADISLRDDGGLSDVAPTMLELLELPKPVEMTGESLILK